jgi:hypothetical protein
VIPLGLAAQIRKCPAEFLAALDALLAEEGLAGD